MIKLNRTTEYGLIALRHMSQKQCIDPSGFTSAREIADSYGFPFEITAKTLQRLRDTGLIDSAHGSRGGYTLQRALNDVTLTEFLDLMEGPQGVVSCTSHHEAGEKLNSSLSSSNKEEATPCAYSHKCELKDPMWSLNQRIRQFLSGIRLAELAESYGTSRAAPVIGAKPVISYEEP